MMFQAVLSNRDHPEYGTVSMGLDNFGETSMLVRGYSLSRETLMQRGSRNQKTGHGLRSTTNIS